MPVFIFVYSVVWCNTVKWKNILVSTDDHVGITYNYYKNINCNCKNLIENTDMSDIYKLN